MILPYHSFWKKTVQSKSSFYQKAQKEISQAHSVLGEALSIPMLQEVLLSSYSFQTPLSSRVGEIPGKNLFPEQ